MKVLCFFFFALTLNAKTCTEMHRALAGVAAGLPPHHHRLTLSPHPPPAKQRGKSLCRCQTEGTLIIPRAQEKKKRKKKKWGGEVRGGICMCRSQQNTNAAGGELHRHTLPLHWKLPPARRRSRTKQRETKQEGFPSDVRSS